MSSAETPAQDGLAMHAEGAHEVEAASLYGAALTVGGLGVGGDAGGDEGVVALGEASLHDGGELLETA
jgi:hypothetical protein